VVVVSGSGAYADPWHDFPTTSARLAEVLAESALSVTVVDDLATALADLRCRLLVLNVGRPSEPRPAAELEIVGSGLTGHLGAGRAVLAVHSSITALNELPAWRRTLGGAWLQGRAMHPPLGPAVLRRTAVEHPISAGAGTVEVEDERYSYLDTEPDITVLYDHVHDDRRHPVVWTRTEGSARVVYDALGHDSRSYESADHRRLLRRSVDWLLESA
jgi:uncharacterized protein